MRPYVLAIHLQPRFVHSLFDLDSCQQLSSQKLSKQMVRQISFLAFISCRFIAFCIMSIPKPSVLNTSRNAVRKYKKRQEREKEIAESFKASSAKVTNLPIIAITRYCKIPNPLSVVSHGIYTELENNFGSRAIFKSVLELFFALTLATLSALSTSQSICKLTLSTSAVSTKYLANSSPQSFSASSVSLVLILPGLKDVFADVK